MIYIPYAILNILINLNVNIDLQFSIDLSYIVISLLLKMFSKSSSSEKKLKVISHLPLTYLAIPLCKYIYKGTYIISQNYQCLKVLWKNYQILIKIFILWFMSYHFYPKFIKAICNNICKIICWYIIIYT